MPQKPRPARKQEAKAERFRYVPLGPESTGSPSNASTANSSASAKQLPSDWKQYVDSKVGSLRSDIDSRLMLPAV